MSSRRPRTRRLPSACTSARSRVSNQPSAPSTSRRPLRVPVVAAHDVGPADLQAADVAGPARAAVLARRDGAPCRGSRGPSSAAGGGAGPAWRSPRWPPSCRSPPAAACRRRRRTRPPRRAAGRRRRRESAGGRRARRGPRGRRGGRRARGTGPGRRPWPAPTRSAPARRTGPRGRTTGSRPVSTRRARAEVSERATSQRASRRRAGVSAVDLEKHALVQLDPQLRHGGHDDRAHRPQVAAQVQHAAVVQAAALAQVHELHLALVGVPRLQQGEHRLALDLAAGWGARAG